MSKGTAVRRGRRSTIVTIFLLTATLQLACAMIGLGPEVVSPEERQAYDAAMGNLPGDPRAAEAALEAFLEQYPKSPLADDAAEQLANLAFADGREEDGLRWLGRILSEAPDSDRAHPARLRLAQYEYGRNRWETARRLLEPLDLERLPLSDQRAALRLRVALSQTPVERVVQLIALHRVLEAEIRERAGDLSAVRRLEERRSAVAFEIREGIRRAASPELEAMEESLRGDEFAVQIALELGRRELDAGQLERAETRLRRTERLVRSDTDRSELRALQERLARLEASARTDASLPPLRALVGRPPPRTDGARGKIGVVLPLSGDFAAFGQQSLRGLLLAADLFAPAPGPVEADGEPLDATAEPAIEPGDPSLEFTPEFTPARSDVRLIVRDSAGDPSRAAAAVRELAADPEIVAIVGPIFSAESLAAAEEAERDGVPLVSLSHREEVPAGRSQVFRTRTRPADEVGVLVDHAFNTLGAQRFAVLYPQTRYGRGMRKLYWEAVTRRGGKIVAASSYDPDATDFSGPIRDMIGYRFLTEGEREALADRSELLKVARGFDPEDAAQIREDAYAALGPEGLPLPPIVDFDVLFIPDSAETVALVAPGLAFHEVQGVRLLGSSDWVDDELLQIGRQHVSGSVISTPFYPESDLPFVASFVERFERTFDRAPDAYAAQAFDAGRLVLVQLASGRTSRSRLRDGLLETRAYPGATGVLSMRPDGNARRRPFLLGVRGRRFVPLD